MPESGGSVNPITEEEAQEYNERKYGIFFAVQDLKSNVRQISNIRSIRCWAIDIDGMSKESQKYLIKRSPLPPSAVVESKNGYHVYWFAKDATVQNYKTIVEHRLIPFFCADTRAKDMARILRMPGYNHWKDKDDPFKVKLVQKLGHVYTEEEMKAFPINVAKEMIEEDSFWQKANNLDCHEMLKRFSGTSAMGGEEITLKENTNGTQQIHVDGKSTSSWLDENGKIGSYDHGGPSITNWLYWYHRDWKRVADILQEYVPKEKKEREQVYLKPIASVMDAVDVQIEEAIASDGKPTGVRSIECIDEKLWGFQKETLYLLAGRTSQGKSALAISIASRAAQYGNRVLYFALESSATSLARRVLAQISEVSTKNIQRGLLTNTDRVNIEEAKKKINEFPILFYEKGGMSSKKIIEVCMRNPTDLIIVDHIQEMVAETPSTSRHLELSSEVSYLKDYCIQAGVPMILISQLRRPAGNKALLAPTMFEIKESGDIENKADVLMAVHRPGQYDPEAIQTEAGLHILKNREGETGVVPLLWTGHLTQFSDPHAPIQTIRKKPSFDFNSGSISPDRDMTSNIV
jgi:replicative DNA helicase